MELTSIPGPQSRSLFSEACRYIPGGVNSPVRAWGRLGGQPPVIAKGEGAWIEDVDGQRYVDYVLSWGPLIHGHAHPQVVDAIHGAAQRGCSFGAPTGAETTLARLLCDAVPGLERVRLVNSGTEATMSALRLARAATGRDLIIKCDGCYHGHADHLLVAAGSGAATFGNPDSAGVPAAFAEKTLVAPYNDAEAIESLLKQHAGAVAAVIIEPVAGNMGFVTPRPGYLEALRKACTEAGTLLVFDEVMTGFRTAWGGHQARCGVTADLVCLGKVIGGGLPAAAYGGSAEIMSLLAPTGPCYQAGTLSGNPIAVAAGTASLQLAGGPAFYEAQEEALGALITGLRELAALHKVPFQVGHLGTMWGFFFSETPVYDFAGSSACDHVAWERFVRSMIADGVYLAPSPFEAAFWSAAHGEAEVAHTLAAAERAFLTLS